MMTIGERWVLFWVILGLAVTGLAITLDWVRVSLRDRAAYVPRHTAEEVDHGRRLNADLPRPRHGAQGEPATPESTAGHETAGPGQPAWGEDDDATLAWARGLRDDDLGDARDFRTYNRCAEPDDTLDGTAVIDYDAPLPAEFIPAERIASGVYVPNLGYDPADLPRRGGWSAGSIGDAAPGQPDGTLTGIGNQPRAGAPAWGRTPDWAWNGQTFVRQTPTGLAWLDALCTAPLRALEAARP